MSPYELLLAGSILVVAVGVGTVAHELAHAVVLRALGVPVDVEWLPDSGERGTLRAGITGTWASVTPRALPADLPPWGLRVASVVPLAMAAPLALVAAGVVPDPFRTGDLYLQLAVVGWLACALPSPQDFSLFWHADSVLEAPERYGVEATG